MFGSDCASSWSLLTFYHIAPSNSLLTVPTSFCDVSPYACSYYFSLVSVSEWSPFGKYQLARLTICSLLYFDY